VLSTAGSAEISGASRWLDAVATPPPTLASAVLSAIVPATATAAATRPAGRARRELRELGILFLFQGSAGPPSNAVRSRWWMRRNDVRGDCAGRASCAES
jgi:hypothetical protein